LGGDGNLIADVRNLMPDFGYVRLRQFGAGRYSEVSATLSYNAQREERVNQGGRGDPLGAITRVRAPCSPGNKSVRIAAL
jgi:hemoglobin/transferrin/lactoferrin receptor protein